MTPGHPVLAAILALRKRLLAARHQNISCETVDVWLDSIDALLPDLRAALQRLGHDRDVWKALAEGSHEAHQADLRAALAPPDEELALVTTRSADLSRELRACVFALAGPAPGDAETLTPERINVLFKCVQAAADYLDAWPKLAARAAALAVAPPRLQEDE